MATWSPETASCNHPEDSADMLTTTTVSAGGKSFMLGSGGRGGGGGGASCRGRRLGARGRATSEATEVGGDEEKSWRKDGDSVAAVERRASDVGGSAGAGGGGGRGRGRSRKEEVVWVQCDKCLRWRKLALGMRLEDLPDKW